MIEILFSILAFVSVAAFGGAWLVVQARRRATLSDRLRPSEASAASAPKPLEARDESPLLRTLGRIGATVSSGKFSTSLRERLARAGYFGRSAATVYLGAKMLLFLAGVAAATVLLLPTAVPSPLLIVLVPASGAVLFFVPDVVVHLRRRQRSEEVRRHLPDVVDLLEICVSSGMGLEMAWNMVSNEIRDVGPTLADEMALVNLEVHLGAPRVEAMRHMVDRTDAQEVVSLTTMIVQTERFGTSIADALRTTAATIREERSLKAQEVAERMPVKLLLPMTLFIFPALLVVLVGPAAIRLWYIINST